MKKMRMNKKFVLALELQSESVPEAIDMTMVRSPGIERRLQHKRGLAPA